ncbi:hypothetical protein NXS19_001993 [Fusarium pseudograminearum]|nr:hypothetical protein NXS19_001993 [Fusarium pseudograminearum]
MNSIRDEIDCSDEPKPTCDRSNNISLAKHSTSSFKSAYWVAMIPTTYAEAMIDAVLAPGLPLHASREQTTLRKKSCSVLKCRKKQVSFDPDLSFRVYKKYGHWHWARWNELIL